MYDLDKKIDEYSEELFVDLGLVSLPEEEKADLYARLEDHLRKVILDTLTPILSSSEMGRIRRALEEEDYRALSRVLRRHPQSKTALEQKIQQEFDQLKLTIEEEQKNAQRNVEGKTMGDSATAPGENS